MQLTVLGGAAACPGPGQGSSSYLVEVDGRHWLLDCGFNTIQELRKHIELDQLERILISHLHADHTLDLVALRYGLTYDPGIERVRPELHLPPDGRTFLDRVGAAFAMGSEPSKDFFEVFESTEYDPDQELRLGGVAVRFHRTNHPVPCWAMRIEAGNRSLVYLADTGPQDGLVEFAHGANVLICEGTFPDHASVAGIEDRPHLSAYEAGRLARDAEVETFVLTHLWASAGISRYLAAATEGFGRQVTLARPGVQVTATPEQGR